MAHPDRNRERAGRLTRNRVEALYTMHNEDIADAMRLFRKMLLERAKRHDDKCVRKGEPAGCRDLIVGNAFIYAMGFDAECDSPEEEIQALGAAVYRDYVGGAITGCNILPEPARLRRVA
jgi:hypothetical protein